MTGLPAFSAFFNNELKGMSPVASLSAQVNSIKARISRNITDRITAKTAPMVERRLNELAGEGSKWSNIAKAQVAAEVAKAKAEGKDVVCSK